MAKKEEAAGGRRRAPKGHFVVYVGNEMKRFVVPISYLHNPMFQQLLNNAADEYGYSNQNGIVLPCDVSTFNSLISFLGNN
uniref:SAUR family protein n=1 Tax=Manihot esculenta TaxID=3983 RepID=A0A2C9WFF6_MANES